MIATPAAPTPPAVDPDLVAAVRRLAAWAGRPCTEAEAADALREVLAFDPDQPRVPAGSPEGGEFGGGEAHAEEDAAVESRRQAEDAHTQAVRDAEDAAHEGRQAVREREEKAHDALQRARDREDARVERARDKEDAATGRQREKEDSATGRARDKEDAAVEKAREEEDGRHDEEADALVDRHEAETKALDKALDKEKASPGERERRTRELDAKQEQEHRELQERHRAEQAALQTARDGEDAERSAGREAGDKATQAKRDAEDHAEEAQREKEDAAREAARAKEDAGHEARMAEHDAADEAHEERLLRREKEDAEAADRREAEDAAREAAREKALGGSAPAALREVLAFNPDQPRDDRGRFGEGGGGGKAGGGLARLGRATWDGVRKAGAAAAHVEHVVKEWVRDRVEAGLSRLPPKAQAVARGVLRVAAVGSKIAFATHLAGQAAAEAVARERGLNPEQARTLRGTLATLDTALCKPVALAGELTGVGGLGVSLVPVASAGYLAYSTARDPMATYRAARGAVRAAGKRLGLLKGAALTGRAKDLIPLVADRYKGLTGEALDWYAGLLAVALDETGDLGPALKIADAAFAEYGTAGAAPQGDPDPLLAEDTADAAASAGLTAGAPDQPRVPAGSPEGGQFGSGGESGAAHAPGERAAKVAALREQMKAHKEEIKRHHESLKRDARAALHRHDQAVGGLRDHVDNIGADADSADPAEAAFGKAHGDLEQMVHAYDPADTVGERAAALKQIGDHATTMIGMNDEITPSADLTRADLDRNEKALHGIVTGTKAAREALKDYVGFRREMRDITGEFDGDLGTDSLPELAAFDHDPLPAEEG